MKKQNKAFTLAETLVVLCVIGVISVLMLSSIGNKINRSKAMFKKAYSLTERTVVELVNDETYYPYDYEKFGFKEDSNVKILGPDICTDGSSANEKGCTGTYNTVYKFCRLFSNNLNLDEKLSLKDNNKCTFSTTDGIGWYIVYSEGRYNKGFIVRIDTNGSKGPNLPSSWENIPSQKNTKNRDRFYMLVRYDGKMEMPDNDEVAKSYLKATDFKDDKQ